MDYPQPDLNLNLETPACVTVAGSPGMLIVSGSAAIFWLIAHQKASTSVPEEISLEAQAAVEALEAGGIFKMSSFAVMPA